MGLAVAYMGSHTILALAFPDAKNMPTRCQPISAHPWFCIRWSRSSRASFSARLPRGSRRTRSRLKFSRGVNRTTRDRSTLPQKSLVIFQSALSLVLLAGAILMTKSLINREHQNFGVATSNRYVLHFDPAGAGYTSNAFPLSTASLKIASLRIARRYEREPGHVQPS